MPFPIKLLHLAPSDIMFHDWSLDLIPFLVAQVRRVFRSVRSSLGVTLAYLKPPYSSSSHERTHLYSRVRDLC